MAEDEVGWLSPAEVKTPGWYWCYRLGKEIEAVKVCVGLHCPSVLFVLSYTYSRSKDISSIDAMFQPIKPATPFLAEF